MIKKVIATSIVMGAMFTLIGCGGGSSSDGGVNSGGGTNPVAIGTAFYIDSAVSGVNYKCGSTEGITGSEGEFTFEVGSSCTFYLGDMELRGVDAGLLVDGESVYETDVDIARILQSLDSDGNPDNGITIKAATVQALADEGIASLPTTDTEMDEMLAVIAANGGTEVSEEDAAEHMLTTLLAGKTFYVVDEAEDGSKQVTKLTFNKDLAFIEAISPEMTENWSISIEGSRLTFNEDTDGSYTMITVDPANDYIMFTDYYSNGSLDGIGHRLYRDKADAEAYFDSLKNPDLEALIVGKTVYQKCGETVDSMTFQANGELVSVENGQNVTVGYRIEGNIVYTIEEDGEDAHIFVDATSDFIKFQETNGGITTFYFTSEAAQAAPPSDCGGDDEGPFSFTTDWLNGKSLYFVQYDDFGYDDMKWNMARMDFTVNTFAWTEYDTVDTGTHTFTYTVNSDGNIVYNYGDGNNHVISFNDMTNDSIKICQDGDCNTYLFFDEGKARDFRDSQN